MADCTDALRMDPRNPDIASLLGGIYEERGMLDEALVWYQMALELNPDNGPDQERLERVTKLTEAKRDRRETASFRTFERRTRIWGLALGIAVAMIVIAAIVTTLDRNPSSRNASARPSRTTQSQDYTPRLNQPGGPCPALPQSHSETAAPSPQAARRREHLVSHTSEASFPPRSRSRRPARTSTT